MKTPLIKEAFVYLRSREIGRKMSISYEETRRIIQTLVLYIKKLQLVYSWPHPWLLFRAHCITEI